MAKKDKKRIFLYYWQMLGTGEYPRSEYVFYYGRKFAADYAFPEQKLLIEIDGGVYGFRFTDKDGNKSWRRGGHSSISGQLADMEKTNYAAMAGYRVMRFTPKQLEEDPHTCIEQVKEALGYEID